MTKLELDEQLRNDCFILGKLKCSQILLLNNALVPWFILVPETDVYEFYELDKDMQQNVLQEINDLSVFLKTEFKVDKLNVATIGNIVQQLHIHVIGRRRDDYCWPNVVWGNKEKRAYSEEEIEIIKSKIINAISYFN